MVEACGRPSNRSSAEVRVSPSENDIYRAVGRWLLSVLPEGFDVLQGQVNRVPAPRGPFATMLIVTRRRLATNAWAYRKSTRSVTEPVLLAVQVTVFGKGAGDAVQQIQTLWRDFYTTDFMREQGMALAPTDTSDPRQMAFINAEANYEDAWSLDLRLNVTLTTTLPQQYADTTQLRIVEADTMTDQESRAWLAPSPYSP